MRLHEWLATGRVSWRSFEAGVLYLPLRLYRQGRWVRAPFKVDTGSAVTVIPYGLVREILPEETYLERARPMGRSDVQGNSLRGMFCEDMQLLLPMNPLDLEDVVHVGTGLWVSRDMKRCGLLGTDFLEQFGLLVLNFPQVEGPYGRGPHFGLLERPGSALSLEEPG